MTTIFFFSVRITNLSHLFHYKNSGDSITSIKHLSSDCDKVSEKPVRFSTFQVVTRFAGQRLSRGEIKV